MKYLRVSIPINRLQQLCEENGGGGSYKGCANCTLVNSKNYPFKECAYQRFLNKQKLKVRGSISPCAKEDCDFVMEDGRCDAIHCAHYMEKRSK